MKQKMYQQFVYKIESSRILRSPDKNLIITPKQARLNGEIISLADSAVLRMIDDLNNIDRNKVGDKVKAIRMEIKELRQAANNKSVAKRKIKELYSRLDEFQIKTDYIEVVISKPSDFDKLNKGFSVNGIEYRRLVGTVNGVKKSTIVYCPVVNAHGIHIHDELNKRMNGEWNSEKEIVLAKFEAYKSLACSASVPVSFPEGVLVVDDLILNFESDIIRLKANDNGEEPVMEELNSYVELNASDGFGLMCPALAERWSKELELDYTVSGLCLRNLFCKGMAFTFDFHEFARRYAESEFVTDVWGNAHNINDIELILPVSVLKLWDNYKSWRHYLDVCKRNGHTFAVTKVCEDRLENERTLNYQFIQSYDFTNEELGELASPTIAEIKGIISGNIDKTILFLKGSVSENYNFNKDNNYLAKALMTQPETAKDPYIISLIHSMIKKKIDDLKIGVLKVHGNYTVIGGDPFAFCQKIFGCDVPDNEKGLLKAGEMYSKYWIDDNKGNNKKVVCFRAPMSCRNNVKTMNVVHNDDIDYWFQYMNTVNIIHVHDTFYMAENGADNDGDCILTTDNPLLLRKTKDTPAIVCVQKKAPKNIVTEEGLRAANKNSFGDDIGTITNRITSMYDIISNYDQESTQYKTLEYRIKCGQLLQQDCID